MYRRLERPPDLPPFLSRFGIRSVRQVRADLGTVIRHIPRRDRFRFNLSSAGLFRPELALPAYLGLVPKDGLAPIFNFFDRSGGGKNFRSFVTRDTAKDYRGGRLSYDEHDGTDFVCPPGTPLACAAPGILVAVRENWLRGGLTACVDHGGGLVTQYTHVAKVVAEIGQPLRRGDTVALSGHGGMDMTQFYPLVPPHVHFMVFVNGAPLDPYRRPGEPDHGGTWLTRNDPRPSAALDERAPAHLRDLAVDEAAVDAAVSACSDPAIRAELERATSAAGRAAILEDSFHHDRFSWPPGAARSLRGAAASETRLTLPLPATDYRGACVIDRSWTR